MNPGGRNQSGADSEVDPAAADHRLVRNYRVATQVIGWIALGSGLMVLVGGWWLGVEPVRAPIPGAAAMKPNTALGFILAGSSLVLYERGRAKLVALASACVILFIAIVTLAEYALGAGATSFDTLLASDDASLVPGRMSVITALCFVLLGTALVLLVLGRAPGLRQGIGVAVQILAFTGVLGYILGDPALTSWGPAFNAIALHTATLILLLGAAIVMAEPTAGWAGVVASPLLGGRLFRAGFLPLVVIVLVMSDAVDYLSEHFQGGHSPLGEALSQLSLTERAAH